MTAQQFIAKVTSNLVLLRYLLVGVINTLVGLGIIYFAMYFLGMSVGSANAVGYSIGILVSFILNKTWTFGSSDRIASSFLRYILVRAVGYAANLITVLFAHSQLGLNAYLAQAIGIVPYTTIGFVGSRYFAFRTQRSAASEVHKAV